MPDQYCTIAFPGTEYPTLKLQPHEPLADHLTVQTSPVLFGCRTGICGTCLVLVTGDIPAADRNEQELLDTLASGTPNARLACQIDLTGDITLQRYHDV